MHIQSDAQILPVGENDEVEEIFLIGQIHEDVEFYNRCRDVMGELISPTIHDPDGHYNFTVKIVTKFRNVLYVQFKDGLYYMGKYLSRQM